MCFRTKFSGIISGQFIILHYGVHHCLYKSPSVVKGSDIYDITMGCTCS